MIFDPRARLWVNDPEGAAMLNIYIMAFGIVLLLMGTLEVAAPLRVLALWRRWIAHRLFFLHGGMLIAAGLPLTCAGGSAAGCILFSFGLLLVFTGPFILIYADRVRVMFLSATSDMAASAGRRLIFIDAALRIAAGLFMAWSSARALGF